MVKPVSRSGLGRGVPDAPGGESKTQGRRFGGGWPSAWVGEQQWWERFYDVLMQPKHGNFMDFPWVFHDVYTYHPSNVSSRKISRKPLAAWWLEQGFPADFSHQPTQCTIVFLCFFLGRLSLIMHIDHNMVIHDV